jgi:hypothetical protein
MSNQSFQTLLSQTKWCSEHPKFIDLYETNLHKYLKSIKNIMFIEEVFNIEIELLCQQSVETEHMILEYVDRGIHSWKTFATLIEENYKKLTSLVLTQNYTLSNDCKEFLDFIREIKLKTFVLDDFQSNFLKNISPKDILDAQPENSIYCIMTSNHEEEHKSELDPVKTTIHINKELNKKLYFHIRHC